MKRIIHRVQSSIGRKQVVAFTGLLLIFFIIGHLVGNLLIFAGPEFYNKYSEFLRNLRPGLYVIEALLGIIFLVHFSFTYMLIHDNVKARSKGYKIQTPKGERSFAAQVMPLTGTILLAFVIYHLYDFTLTPHNGAQSILSDGINYGLYGLVYNSFTDWLHSTFYIIAMLCLGFHLSHGIESFCQTYGFMNRKSTGAIRFVSQSFGVIVSLLFSSIPLYILIKNLGTF